MTVNDNPYPADLKTGIAKDAVCYSPRLLYTGSLLKAA